MNAPTPPGAPAADLVMVEDSPTQAEQLRFLLEGQGYAVRHGRNGAEGLALVRERRPLAVISDITMPVMNGFELCRSLRGDPALADLPVLLLTSLSDPEDVIQALECGADYFFTKPIDAALLVPRLQQLAQSRVAPGAAEGAGPVTVTIGGRVHRIAAGRLQTLHLLLSTYESAVAQNHRLERIEAKLRQLNESLEARVRERTLDLQHSNEVLHAENVARCEVEARLREQATLLDKASEAIITVDLEDRIRFWNRGAERLLGWTSAEMVGRPIGHVMSLGDQGPADRPPGDWRGETHSLNRKGEQLILETSITVLRDDQGRPTGRFIISTDVTERKSLEEKFLRVQRLESIGMLAAGIAHDLNNVLAPIAMASSLLRGRLQDPADLRMVETLERSANRGTGLVKQILGFAQGVGGEHREVQPKHLVRDIAAVLTRTLPKSIVLEEQVPSDLWPVTGNPTQIHQVLMNLCVNARDAMASGGRLRLRAENCRFDAAAAKALALPGPGSWVKLEVGDTGTGIPPDVLARIWEPFFTTKAQGEGTGLGLSTVRGIVKTHHGIIKVETTPGQGTTFTVFLPASGVAGAEGEEPVADSVAAGKGELILVADDDESIRETTSEILTTAGYRVVTAVDGTSAAVKFVSEPARFSLVVTDFDMPGMDGEGFASIVRARRPNLRVLVISGFDSRGRTRFGGREIGDAHLSKPFSAPALLAAVAALLRGERVSKPAIG